MPSCSNFDEGKWLLLGTYCTDGEDVEKFFHGFQEKKKKLRENRKTKKSVSAFFSTRDRSHAQDHTTWETDKQN